MSRLSLRLMALASLSLLGFAGCSSDSKPGPTPGGDTSNPPPGDTTPGEDTTTPQPDTGTPGDSSFCRSNDECEGNAICDCTGSCVTPTGQACQEDRNCGIPNWCNTCTGHCEPQAKLCEPCTEARGCQDNGACLPFASGGNFCGLACISDAGCPTGYGCQDVAGVTGKQCVPKSGQCETLNLCENDTECPIGQICNSTTRQCADGCTEDGQCQVGQVCVGSRCGPPCGSNADCVAPAVCESNGKCKIPGSCESAADCPAPATYCDRVTGMCADGCQVDSDCGNAAKVCKQGSCVDKGCLHNFECSFGNVCNQSNGQCEPFPESEPHCAVCDPQAENSPACPDPNICVSFEDNDGNALGDHCLVPCKDDPIDRCPSGWQCQAFEDQDGNQQHFCTRACYINPVGGSN